MPELCAVKADITRLDVDGIVNAANSSLLGGGGVDGAIHRAAGPGLLEACRRLNGCPAGQARITPGFDLPTRYVIHTVGPIWRGGDAGEPGVLADCYRNCLALAAEHDLRSIAFPAISTGAYGFPIELATDIAVSVAAAFIANDDQRPISILFCCFSAQDLAIYQRELQNRS